MNEQLSTYPAGPDSYEQDDRYQEALDGRRQELAMTIGALALVEESFNTKQPINSLLTEQVGSGQMSRDEAQATADEVRTLIREAYDQDHPDDTDKAADLAEKTTQAYRSDPVGLEGINKINRAGNARVRELGTRIRDAQDGVELFQK